MPEHSDSLVQADYEQGYQAGYIAGYSDGQKLASRDIWRREHYAISCLLEHPVEIAAEVQDSATAISMDDGILTPYTFNRLHRINFRTTQDLLQTSANELHDKHMFGLVSLFEITRWLAARGHRIKIIAET